MKDLTTTLESKQCMGVCMQLTDSPIDELWTLAGSSSALDAVVCAEMLCTDVMANPWGMTGELDGPLGQHLVGLGEPAVAALRPLLDDDRVIRSSGSREATYATGSSIASRISPRSSSRRSASCRSRSARTRRCAIAPSPRCEPARSRREAASACGVGDYAA